MNIAQMKGLIKTALAEHISFTEEMLEKRVLGLGINIPSRRIIFKNALILLEHSKEINTLDISFDGKKEKFYIDLSS